ncbi:MAG: hypothetical protein M3M99_04000, partial [Actinomycetota bacterium]|nr:hypothetical protein [Actinomycetota bacterium]
VRPGRPVPVRAGGPARDRRGHAGRQPGLDPFVGLRRGEAERFLTLTLLATVAPFFLIKEARDVRRFFFWIIVLAFVTAGLALASPPPAGAGRLEFGGEGNTIGVSQLLCTAALVLLLAGLGDRASAAGGRSAAGWPWSSSRRPSAPAAPS